MRALTVEEVGQVSGGDGYMEYVKSRIDEGGKVGAAVGYIVTGTVQGAARGGVVGGALSFAFYSGYWIGTQIYEAYCG